jgi:TolB-like protein/Tfp pilus assembly protein PilF
VVHRDIKPSNIIIDSKGRARILDFGLATITGEDKLTKTGSTLGTVGYMAPEQIMGTKVDKRADIFSVGVILYEMITSKQPFYNEFEAAIINAILNEIPEPIARFKSGVTGELQQIIDKALAKDPSLRYQHADGMLADLKRLQIDTIPHKKSRAGYWAAIVAIIVIGGYFISNLLKDPQKSTQDEPPVLIVLPFENLGSEADEYFSDGIRDEIGSRLSTVKGLRVISPRSADKYKETDKSFEEIGQETGADYILEATIRWDKSEEIDRFRITPKLTKTSDNYLMWSINYEEQLVRIFDVQSEIAGKIVVALGLTLLEPGKDAPDYAPTTNMAAYNFYLLGLELTSRGIYNDDLRPVIEMYDSALALDSNFALAWAQKSMAHSKLNFSYTTVDARFHKREAKRAADKALSFDPNLVYGRIALGTYYNLVEREYEKALGMFSEAWSETSSNADLSEAIGIVKMRQGKWQEALANFEEAARIDPLSPKRYFYLATCYSLLRDYTTANSYLDRGMTLDPRNTDVVYMKVMLNLLNYGSIEYGEWTFDKMAEGAGLTEISTYELASSNALGLWRFITNRIDPHEAIRDARLVGIRRSPHLAYLSLGQIYDLTDRPDTAQMYYDSSRIRLNELIDEGDVEFHAYAELGITYSLIPITYSAIAAGKTAKEMMAVDDCHW